MLAAAELRLSHRDYRGLRRNCYQIVHRSKPGERPPIEMRKEAGQLHYPASARSELCYLIAIDSLGNAFGDRRSPPTVLLGLVFFGSHPKLLALWPSALYLPPVGGEVLGYFRPPTRYLVRSDLASENQATQ